MLLLRKMSEENFNKAVDFILQWETMNGAKILVDDPNDKGGLTKYGISSRSHPDLDIQGLTLVQATTIYRTEYWDRAGCNMLPYPVDIAVFNMAVTSGVATAKRLETPSVDFEDFIISCIKYYIDIKGQVLEGWINRAVDLFRTFRKLY